MKRIKPKFSLFDKQMISIDFGSDFIKIIVGRFQNEAVIIEKAHTLQTTESAYADGVIRHPEALKKQMIEFLNENKISISKAVCTFHSSQFIIREIEIPNVKTSLFDSVIKYELQKYLPIELHEYVVDYQVLEETNEGKTVRMLVTALPNVIAESYYVLLQQIGLKPLCLSTHSNALEKLFTRCSNLKITKEIIGSIAVLEIGHRDVDVSVICNRKIRFSRTLIERPNEVIKRSIEDWAVEIQRVIQFYNNNEYNPCIEKVYIYGESKDLNGLEENLKQRLHLKIERVLEISSMIFNTPMDSSETLTYMNAAGAIIR